MLPAGRGCSLVAAALLVLFSFLSALRTQKLTFGGPELLMTVASVFTDTAGNTRFLTPSLS